MNIEYNLTVIFCNHGLLLKISITYFTLTVVVVIIITFFPIPTYIHAAEHWYIAVDIHLHIFLVDSLFKVFYLYIVRVHREYFCEYFSFSCFDNNRGVDVNVGEFLLTHTDAHCDVIKIKLCITAYIVE